MNDELSDDDLLADDMTDYDPVDCDRSMHGHAWFEVDDPGAWNPYRKFFSRQVDRCFKCTTYRYRGLNAYGQVESTWYDYSSCKGWDDRWGVGNVRPSGDDIRKANLLPRKERRRKK